MSKLDELMMLLIRLQEIRKIVKRTSCPVVLKQLNDEIDDIIEEQYFITERNHDGTSISL